MQRQNIYHGNQTPNSGGNDNGKINIAATGGDTDWFNLLPFVIEPLH